jgi:hypothetical protein
MFGWLGEGEGRTLANIGLIKTMSTAIAESFEERGSIAAKWRDFGVWGVGREINV